METRDGQGKCFTYKEEAWRVNPSTPPSPSGREDIPFLGQGRPAVGSNDRDVGIKRKSMREVRKIGGGSGEPSPPRPNGGESR
jgi:hypothetical protein